MIKGVIFDMDGVIVDNRDIHYEAFKTFCKRHGHTVTDDQLLPLFGKGNEEIVPLLLPQEYVDKIGWQELAEEKEVIYRDIFADRIEPAPGLITFLETLKAHGLKCAVGSSGPAGNVQFVLEKCNITKFFDATVNGDMVKNAKPDPAIFLMAAKLMDLDPSECLVIEDAPAGIEAARRAGMKVFGLVTTFPREMMEETDTDKLVSGFPELGYTDIEELN